MTTGDSYKQFISQLKNIYNESEAKTITDWVFENITGIKTLVRITEPQTELNKDTTDKLDNALRKLIDHTPVQYVLNEAWFFKMKFFVNENVLIPRPETEELVEWVIEEIRNKKSEIRNKPARMTRSDGEGGENSYSLTTHYSPLTNHHSPLIFEVGSGSGCIAVALKQQTPDSEIISVDISEEALNVAKKNAQLHNADIQFMQSDFLDESIWDQFPLFDIIISNPPYIPASEKEKLSKNVVEHEPHTALFVTENDPLTFYKKIAKFSTRHLKPSGKIFVEVHEDYSPDVAKIFEAEDLIVTVRKDIFGKERMIKIVQSS